ncbi:unnamed protein product [Protopolystoma xenopodis]|uniref:Uncharacterized protein n=1 Tax=Protopolystoma xenopodis TaxID=117903 RepID=A0A448XP41_9PLAT|nr:unnamed protein product [Protopolystoma xenopodis]
MSGFKRDPVLETSVEFICAAKANSSFYSRQALHQQRFNLLRTAPNASILSPANDRIPFHLVLMGRDGLNALSIEQLSTLIGFSALGSSEKGMLCHLAIPLPLHDSPLTFHLIRLEREDRQLTCMAFFETALFVYQAAAALAHFEPRISPRQPAHFCISKFGLSIAAESAETGLPPILPGQPLAEVERLLAPTLARIETLALCGSLGPGETCFTERDKQKVSYYILYFFINRHCHYLILMIMLEHAYYLFDQSHYHGEKI